MSGLRLAEVSFRPVGLRAWLRLLGLELCTGLSGAVFKRVRHDVQAFGILCDGAAFVLCRSRSCPLLGKWVLGLAVAGALSSRHEHVTGQCRVPRVQPV